MIYLDSYVWVDGKTYVRVWDSESPDSLMESVERPHARVMRILEEEVLHGRDSRTDKKADLTGDHRAGTSDAARKLWNSLVLWLASFVLGACVVGMIR